MPRSPARCCSGDPFMRLRLCVGAGGIGNADEKGRRCVPVSAGQKIGVVCGGPAVFPEMRSVRVNDSFSCKSPVPHAAFARTRKNNIRS